jgi:outer membrane lipoprotein SlyB
MTKPLRLIGLVLFAAGALAACAPVHSGSSYGRTQVGQEQRVSRGTILAMREVRITGTETGAGTIGGGVIGGVAGSTIGQGARANIAGAAAGAVLGAVLGSMAEGKLTETTATEFTVREQNGAIIAVVQANDERLREGERVVVVRGEKLRILRDTLPADATAPARGS